MTQIATNEKRTAAAPVVLFEHMKRQTTRDGSTTLRLTPAGSTQAFLVAGAAGSDVCDAAAAYRLLAEALERHGLAIVHERAFGTTAALAGVLDARQALGDAGQRPLTYVVDRPAAGEGFAGLQVQAVVAGEVQDLRTITDGGEPCGRAWSCDGRDFIILQAAHGATGASPVGKSGAAVGTPFAREAQATAMIRRAEELLAAQGASYKHVARTWIYLDRILDWYGPFNAARNAEYARMGVLASGDGASMPPASTGIAAANPAGAACMMDVLAVVDRSRPDVAAVGQMTNAMQKDAFRYGSAFSRGAFVDAPGGQIVHISGTAAIDRAGDSMFLGDTRRQIAQTLDHVDALLAQRGLGLADIASATLFLKHRRDLPILREILAARGLADMPGVCVEADVCRDDLLFELDGVAAIAR